MPAYSPRMWHYNCAEGGVMLLEGGTLCVTLSHAVQLDFVCRAMTHRVCLYLHATACAHTSRVSVCFRRLDVRTPMAAVVYATGAPGGAHVHRVVPIINMRKSVPANDARSEMQMHTTAIDRLHQTRKRNSHNVARWPRALHAFAFTDDTLVTASTGERAHMRAACAADAQLAWSAEHMPAHQLYALGVALERSVLVRFLDTVRPLCTRVAQLHVYGSTADTLQDHTVALYLGYTPAFSVLYSAGVELALAMATLCEPQITSRQASVARRRLARVREQQGALASHEPAHTLKPALAPLSDFTSAMRACLLSEVVCECVVDVFHGGSLVCARDTPMFASPISSELQLPALNAELRARSLHPGPCYEHNASHLRALLSEDAERGIFCEAPAAWPRLTRARLWLREAERAGGGASARAAVVRDFVAVSAAHHRDTVGRALHGTHAHARVTYSEKMARFMGLLSATL